MIDYEFWWSPTRSAKPPLQTMPFLSKIVNTYSKNGLFYIYRPVKIGPRAIKIDARMSLSCKNMRSALWKSASECESSGPDLFRIKKGHPVAEIWGPNWTLLKIQILLFFLLSLLFKLACELKTSWKWH